ncbi:MAG: hypothetical protein R3342_10120 [Lutibacter sp.]|uniref:hypothetical protein n=1 Tax=Lutibacter sp. TaxID=1925666 RepID=UPI00299DD100|nr:hypothetical protein [Lutibacter sp.]MDX1829886.1 hypothetical protein [Lutibacter sp.]
MKKNFKYQFDNSLGILFKFYYGLITIEDIESSWEYAFKNSLIPKDVKGFILDYRNSNFNIKVEEYNKIADFYKKHLEVFGNFKIAILTEEPRDIVIPVLVETKDQGYSSRPFSTLNSAIDWVLS